MKYDTKEKVRLRMDELFAKNEEMIKERIASEAIDNGYSDDEIKAVIACKMDDLQKWREETLVEAWRWATDMAAPSLKAH